MSKPLLAGDPVRLGDYELLSRLGTGGMGTVYLGRDHTGRRVAVKVIRAEFSWDDELRRRFRSEVNRARQVPSFATAAVLDADLEHNPPYLVVEFVDGPSLADVVRDQGPLPVETLRSVAVGIATALVGIHGAGVIHRDLKPENVLFGMGGIKVIDFGIARPMEITSQHTRTDQMVGTVAYMAPERFEADASRTVTPAADIFAWGIVIAHAATGHTPFEADSTTATAMRILTQPPNLTGIDDPLRELVGWALVKNPGDRPTARELLDALLVDGSPSPVPMPAGFARRSEPVPAEAATTQVSPAVLARPTRAQRRRLQAQGLRRWRWGVTAGVVAVLCVGIAVTCVLLGPILALTASDEGASVSIVSSARQPDEVAASGQVSAEESVGASTAASAEKPATRQAMLELLSQLLPGSKFSDFRSPSGNLQVQLYLNDGDGPGMLRVTVDGPAAAANRDRTGEPKISVESYPGNCIQSVVIVADWPDGTTVKIEIATCLAWDGTQNKPARAPLSIQQATKVAVDPRWGTYMDASLVEAGAKSFPAVR